MSALDAIWHKFFNGSVQVTPVRTAIEIRGGALVSDDPVAERTVIEFGSGAIPHSAFVSTDFEGTSNGSIIAPDTTIQFALERSELISEGSGTPQYIVVGPGLYTTASLDEIDFDGSINYSIAALCPPRSLRGDDGIVVGVTGTDIELAGTGTGAWYGFEFSADSFIAGSSGSTAFRECKFNSPIVCASQLLLENCDLRDTVTANTLHADRCDFVGNITITGSAALFNDCNIGSSGPVTVTFSGSPGGIIIDAQSWGFMQEAGSTFVNAAAIVIQGQDQSRYHGSFTSTNATIATVATIPCTDNALTIIAGMVWARDTGSNWYQRKISLSVTRSAGGNCVIKADDSPADTDDITITGMTFTVSTSNILARFTGHASTHLSGGYKFWTETLPQVAAT